MRAIRLLLCLCSITMLSVPMSGCNSLRRKVARKLGVRMKKHTIKIADLGPAYRKLKNGHNDFFNPAKKVTRKTGRRAIVISYRTVGIPSLDVTLRDANLTFAQYRFADAIVSQIHKDLRKIFSLDFLKTNERELRSAVKGRRISNMNMVKRLRRSKQTLAFLIPGMRDIAAKAGRLKASVGKLKTQGVAELKRDPRRAILAPEMIKEAATPTKRLYKVARGAPGLITKLLRLQKVFSFLPL